jgi:hypothetical protein
MVNGATKNQTISLKGSLRLKAKRILNFGTSTQDAADRFRVVIVKFSSLPETGLMIAFAQEQ